MNLAILAAVVGFLLGGLLAVIDQLSDSTNIELPIYLLILFFSLAALALGHLVGKVNIQV